MAYQSRASSAVDADRRTSVSVARSSVALTWRPITLWTHEPPNFSIHEVVINPDVVLQGLSENDLLELTLPDNDASHRAPKKRRHARSRPAFVFKAADGLADPGIAARQPQLQISVSKSIASFYGFHNRCEAVLRKVSRKDHTVDHVELYFRDQYVGRADMWRLSMSLEDTCVYVGQKISLAGCVRATVGRIFIREKKVTSGYITPSTKTIFRSESAKYNIFIQMCREMWEFDEDGELYYEKALQGFIPELLKRWRSVSTNHVISVTLFSRVYYDQSELHMLEGPLRRDMNGKWYIDYYKVIVDLESNCDWTAVMTVLKEEFYRFQHDIMLLRRPVAGPAASQEELHADVLRDRALLAGRLAYSYEGNILEAVNLALNPFDEHYIDRDLNRTGLSMLVITAGTGHFEVDKKLLRLTTERMIDNGIGLDLVCLTKMPLHSVPLFHFRSHVPEPPEMAAASAIGSTRNRRALGTKAVRAAAANQHLARAANGSWAPPDPLYYDSNRPAHEETDFYSMPHWIDCSFYNLQQDKPFRADRFVPRCKMYEVQMMGIMENEITNISIPFLDLKLIGRPSSTQSSFVIPQGPSSFLDASDPTTSAGSELAIAGLNPREQRKLARDRFDSATFRDLEAPRPVLRQGTLPAGSPIRSYPRQRAGDPTSPTKGGRSSRYPRKDGRASTVLESHAEHASPPAANRHSLAPSEDAEETENLTSGPASRTGSIRSVATFHRGLRPLEPMGKAKALVAPSDPLLAATSQYALGSDSTATTSAPPSPSPSLALGALTKPEGVSRGVAYRISTSWLWSSLRGQTGGNSSQGIITKEQLESSSAASRRIQEVLNAKSKGSVVTTRPVSLISPGELRSPAGRLSTKKSPPLSPLVSHVGGTSGPSPISIPSHISGRARTASDADAKILLEQEAYEQQLEEEEARQRFAQKAQVEKQTLVNPSNPRKNLQNHSSQLLRWQHLFPRHLNRHAVKWRSMTSPACLPLTTYYFPTDADLAAKWQEYPHTTSISSETTSFMLKRAASTTPALAVLREMASQRLAQGFQFIVPTGKEIAASSRSLNDPRHFTLRHPSELLQPGNLSAGNPIFLSMSNQIHRISYDRSAGAIDVKRYVRKTEYSTEGIDYECCIWPRHSPGYQTVKARFSYPSFGSYNWTYLDSLIAGYVDEQLVESLRYWRTRFVLVPSEGSPPPMKAPTGENLSDEEIRLIGTDKLAELFAKARWLRPGEKPEHFAALRFLPTSLDPATSVLDEQFMKQLAAGEEEYVADEHSKKVLKDASLEAVAKEMRSEHGVKINDRLWHRILYADTFTGADFVTWLCREYSDVKTREDAIEWGIKFHEQGLFEHVTHGHGFLDGHYFYRLKGDFAPARPSKGWFRSSTRAQDEGSAEKDVRASPAKGNSRRNASGTSSSDSSQPTPRRRLRVQMSRSMIIDVDPGRKSERAEVAFLHHDIAHNPANGFNFQIHWLGTTARFIEDLVQVWTRTVERYGLRLIEAPIGQIKDVSKHNPFQAPLQLRLALAPPAPQTFARRLPENVIADQFFESALLRKFGFILDQEASHRYPRDVDIAYSSRPAHFEYSQYVHRTGVAFVQVLGGTDGFLWLNNRLFTSHLQLGHKQPKNQPAPDPDHVRREFTAFCANPETLDAFYRQTLASLESAPSKSQGQGQNQNQNQSQSQNQSHGVVGGGGGGGGGGEPPNKG